MTVYYTYQLLDILLVDKLTNGSVKKVLGKGFMFYHWTNQLDKI